MADESDSSASDAARRRHHPVEAGPPRRQLPHRGQCARAVGRRMNLESLVPKSRCNELGDVRFVVYDQYAMNRHEPHYLRGT